MAIMIRKFKKGKFLKGDIGKQAHGHIWVPFLCFSRLKSVFNFLALINYLEKF
jgi:hypothetical protein